MDRLTVGRLRAELALYDEDTPVEVYVPDGPGRWRVLPIVAAGYGPGVTPDEMLGSSLPLRAGLPVLDEPDTLPRDEDAEREDRSTRLSTPG